MEEKKRGTCNRNKMAFIQKQKPQHRMDAILSALFQPSNIAENSIFPKAQRRHWHDLVLTQLLCTGHI
jgi:hypothetical protein